MKYDFKKVEEKWQKEWEKSGIYNAKDKVKGKKNFYHLVMFPYPSGDLHIGHWYNFAPADVYARFKRMSGSNVMSPIGFDAFGLPAENAAIKRKVHPKDWTLANIKNMTVQLKTMGNSYDWSRAIITCLPEYYKWNQFIFLELYKKGLVYRKKAPANWCPNDKTVLANEQVVDGKCERCGAEVIQKDIDQWLFKITAYAEKLLSGLDKVDWPERTKTIQRNWIGKSEGALVKFKVESLKLKVGEVDVFTTRPDTLFGATYVVLAPEHELVLSLKNKISNWKEVQSYIGKSRKKTELQRTDLSKEKTGVELKGVKAVNPANGEKIPVWIADYVLSSYGTGAIMAVPAHDERDFEFAKKFGLSIKQVVAEETGIKRPGEERRDGAFAVVFDPKRQKYAVGKYDDGRLILLGGGVDDGEKLEDGVKREIAEESGLYDFAKIEKIGTAHAHYRNIVKNIDRVAEANCFLVVLKSGRTKPDRREEHEKFKLDWVAADQMIENWISINQNGDYSHWINLARESVARAIELGFDKVSDPEKYKQLSYDGDGILVNSGKFTGMDSEKAKWEITKLVGGKKKIQYRLRDWLISRQRYWGTPIPIIYCEKCGIVPEKEDNLPIVLPPLKNYKPADDGRSPLARNKNFLNTKCPKCGCKAERETDTMDTFVDSSWYFLRYTDSKNKKTFADKDKIKNWLPVDMYIGGAEHTVLHLLYSRFFTKFLYGDGYLNFDEPFSALRHQGIILGPDGQKMSKSRGNIVSPDKLVNDFSADAVRIYLCFIGPYEQGGPWNPGGIVGVVRFINRVWDCFSKKDKKRTDGNSGNLERVLNQTIKKVGEDIEGLKFNTAVSALMICLNELERYGNYKKETLEKFLKILSPFAPHITEELWHKLSNKQSIHLEPWPKYDPKLIVNENFELVIQINGKVRDRITVPRGVGKKEAEELALSQEKIKSIILGNKPRKIIFVPDRLVNIVI